VSAAQEVLVSALKLIALILVVVVTATVVQPARAEAMDAMTVLAIVGAAVGVALIIAVVVIANVREKQTGGSAALDDSAVVEPPLAAVVQPPVAVASDAGAQAN
jgi:NADH:ubiquinone oxidoreductase subunit 6 (subunit J)